jgi:hypothetical protein
MYSRILMEYRSIEGNKSNDQIVSRCWPLPQGTAVERECITERKLCTLCRERDEEAIHQIPSFDLHPRLRAAEYPR